MEKKKRILEIELEEARKLKKIDVFSTIIEKAILDHFKSIYNLLESKQELYLLIAQENNTRVENADASLIDILEYKRGEILKIGLNLFPYNMFKLESYFTHYNLKERIKSAIKSKLYELKDSNSDEQISNTLDRAILIFEIFKDGRKADFDNYYMKPYVDAIVESGFLVNDTSHNLKVLYSPLNTKKYLIEITLINQDAIMKYQDLLLKVIVS